MSSATMSERSGPTIIPQTEPRFVTLPPAKFAVVHVTGAARHLRDEALESLYASVGALRAVDEAAGLDFDLGPLRMRVPDAQMGPLHLWRSVFALPVPDRTVEMPQTDPTFPVDIEVWVYGTAAELLHEGPEETKPVTVQRLQEFIIGNKRRLAGWREEIYLGTGPHGGRTLLRYPIV